MVSISSVFYLFYHLVKFTVLFEQYFKCYDKIKIDFIKYKIFITIKRFFFHYFYFIFTQDLEETVKCSKGIEQVTGKLVYF